jgi:hypothetical protein
LRIKVVGLREILAAGELARMFDAENCVIVGCFL